MEDKSSYIHNNIVLEYIGSAGGDLCRDLPGTRIVGYI